MRAQAASRATNALVTLRGSPVRHQAVIDAWRPLWDPTGYVAGVDDPDTIDSMPPIDQ